MLVKLKLLNKYLTSYFDLKLIRKLDNTFNNNDFSLYRKVFYESDCNNNHYNNLFKFSRSSNISNSKLYIALLTKQFENLTCLQSYEINNVINKDIDYNYINDDLISLDFDTSNNKCNIYKDTKEYKNSEFNLFNNVYASSFILLFILYLIVTLICLCLNASFGYILLSFIFLFATSKINFKKFNHNFNNLNLKIYYFLFFTLLNISFYLNKLVLYCCVDIDNKIYKLFFFIFFKVISELLIVIVIFSFVYALYKYIYIQKINCLIKSVCNYNIIAKNNLGNKHINYILSKHDTYNRLVIKDKFIQITLDFSNIILASFLISLCFSFLIINRFKLSNNINSKYYYYYIVYTFLHFFLLVLINKILVYIIINSFTNNNLIISKFSDLIKVEKKKNFALLKNTISKSISLLCIRESSNYMALANMDELFTDSNIKLLIKKHYYHSNLTENINRVKLNNTYLKSPTKSKNSKNTDNYNINNKNARFYGNSEHFTVSYLNNKNTKLNSNINDNKKKLKTFNLCKDENTNKTNTKSDCIYNDELLLNPCLISKDNTLIKCKDLENPNNNIFIKESIFTEAINLKLNKNKELAYLTFLKSLKSSEDISLLETIYHYQLMFVNNVPSDEEYNDYSESDEKVDSIKDEYNINNIDGINQDVKSNTVNNKRNKLENKNICLNNTNKAVNPILRINNIYNSKSTKHFNEDINNKASNFSFKNKIDYNNIKRKHSPYYSSYTLNNKLILKENNNINNTGNKFNNCFNKNISSTNIINRLYKKYNLRSYSLISNNVEMYRHDNNNFLYYSDSININKNKNSNRVKFKECEFISKFDQNKSNIIYNNNDVCSSNNNNNNINKKSIVNNLSNNASLLCSNQSLCSILPKINIIKEDFDTSNNLEKCNSIDDISCNNTNNKNNYHLKSCLNNLKQFNNTEHYKSPVYDNNNILPYTKNNKLNIANISVISPDLTIKKFKEKALQNINTNIKQSSIGKKKFSSKSLNKSNKSIVDITNNKNFNKSFNTELTKFYSLGYFRDLSKNIHYKVYLSLTKINRNEIEKSLLEYITEFKNKEYLIFTELFFENVTSLIEVENKLNQSAKKFGVNIAKTAHEFKTPINTIVSLCDSLINKLNNNNISSNNTDLINLYKNKEASDIYNTNSITFNINNNNNNNTNNLNNYLNDAFEDIKVVKAICDYTSYLIHDFIHAAQNKELEIKIKNIKIFDTIQFCHVVSNALIKVGSNPNIKCSIIHMPSLSKYNNIISVINGYLSFLYTLEDKNVVTNNFNDLGNVLSSNSNDLNIIKFIEYFYDVLSDDLRLKQLLLNFLSNSVKFTHYGSITIEIDMKLKDTTLNKISESPEFIVVDNDKENNISKIYNNDITSGDSSKFKDKTDFYPKLLNKTLFPDIQNKRKTKSLENTMKIDYKDLDTNIFINKVSCSTLKNNNNNNLLYKSNNLKSNSYLNLNNNSSSTKTNLTQTNIAYISYINKLKEILLSTDGLTIKITDTGYGLTEEQLEKIRLKKSSELLVNRILNSMGTSLGLSICHSILEKLGYEIDINSKLKEGTTIIIYLKNVLRLKKSKDEINSLFNKISEFINSNSCNYNKYNLNENSNFITSKKHSILDILKHYNISNNINDNKTYKTIYNKLNLKYENASNDNKDGNNNLSYNDEYYLNKSNIDYINNNSFYNNFLNQNLIDNNLEYLSDNNCYDVYTTNNNNSDKIKYYVKNYKRSIQSQLFNYSLIDMNLIVKNPSSGSNTSINYFSEIKCKNYNNSFNNSNNKYIKKKSFNNITGNVNFYHSYKNKIVSTNSNKIKESKSFKLNKYNNSNIVEDLKSNNLKSSKSSKESKYIESSSSSSKEVQNSQNVSNINLFYINNKDKNISSNSTPFFLSNINSTMPKNSKLVLNKDSSLTDNSYNPNNSFTAVKISSNINKDKLIASSLEYNISKNKDIKYLNNNDKSNMSINEKITKISNKSFNKLNNKSVLNTSLKNNDNNISHLNRIKKFSLSSSSTTNTKYDLKYIKEYQNNIINLKNNKSIFTFFNRSNSNINSNKGTLNKNLTNSIKNNYFNKTISTFSNVIEEENSNFNNLDISGSKNCEYKQIDNTNNKNIELNNKYNTKSYIINYRNNSKKMKDLTLFPIKNNLKLLNNKLLNTKNKNLNVKFNDFKNYKEKVFNEFNKYTNNFNLKNKIKTSNRSKSCFNLNTQLLLKLKSSNKILHHFSERKRKKIINNLNKALDFNKFLSQDSLYCIKDFKDKTNLIKASKQKDSKISIYNKNVKMFQNKHFKEDIKKSCINYYYKENDLYYYLENNDSKIRYKSHDNFFLNSLYNNSNLIINDLSKNNKYTMDLKPINISSKAIYSESEVHCNKNANISKQNTSKNCCSDYSILNSNNQFNFTFKKGILSKENYLNDVLNSNINNKYNNNNNNDYNNNNQNIFNYNYNNLTILPFNLNLYHVNKHSSNPNNLKNDSNNKKDNNNNKNNLNNTFLQNNLTENAIKCLYNCNTKYQINKCKCNNNNNNILNSNIKGYSNNFTNSYNKFSSSENNLKDNLIHNNLKNENLNAFYSINNVINTNNKKASNKSLDHIAINNSKKNKRFKNISNSAITYVVNSCDSKSDIKNLVSSTSNLNNIINLNSPLRYSSNSKLNKYGITKNSNYIDYSLKSKCIDSNYTNNIRYNSRLSNELIIFDINRHNSKDSIIKRINNDNNLDNISNEISKLSFRKENSNKKKNEEDCLQYIIDEHKIEVKSIYNNCNNLRIKELSKPKDKMKKYKLKSNMLLHSKGKITKENNVKINNNCKLDNNNKIISYINLNKESKDLSKNTLKKDINSKNDMQNKDYKKDVKSLLNENNRIYDEIILKNEENNENIFFDKIAIDNKNSSSLDNSEYSNANSNHPLNNPELIKTIKLINNNKFDDNKNKIKATTTTTNNNNKSLNRYNKKKHLSVILNNNNNYVKQYIKKSYKFKNLDDYNYSCYANNLNKQSKNSVDKEIYGSNNKICNSNVIKNVSLGKIHDNNSNNVNSSYFKIKESKNSNKYRDNNLCSNSFYSSLNVVGSSNFNNVEENSINRNNIRNNNNNNINNNNNNNNNNNSISKSLLTNFKIEKNRLRCPVIINNSNNNTNRVSSMNANSYSNYNNGYISSSSNITNNKNNKVSKTDYNSNNKSTKTTAEINSDNKNNCLRILIADDMPIMANSLKNNLSKILKKRNIEFDIIVCKDGIDIIYEITKDQTKSNKIKFIFTDEQMKFVNGSEAMAKLKELENNNKIKFIPIAVCVSCFDSTETFQTSFKYDCVLPKISSNMEIYDELFQKHNIY